MRQAAERLGIKPATLYRMLGAGEISHLRHPSGFIRIWIEHIEEFERGIGGGAGDTDKADDEAPREAETPPAEQGDPRPKSRRKPEFRERRGITAKEAARYLGLSAAAFRKLLTQLLSEGFPRVDPLTNRYDRWAIDDWLDARGGRGEDAHEERALGERIAGFGGEQEADEYRERVRKYRQGRGRDWSPLQKK